MERLYGGNRKFGSWKTTKLFSNRRVRNLFLKRFRLKANTKPFRVSKNGANTGIFMRAQQNNQAGQNEVNHNIVIRLQNRRIDNNQNNEQ